MANSTENILKQSLEIIENDKCVFFIEDIISLLPISKPTFYDYIKNESNELNTIKEALNKNKIAKKVQIRSQLGKSNKAAELLSLYKLIATEDERKALSQNYIDHTSKGEKVNIPPVNWVNGSD